MNNSLPYPDPSQLPPVPIRKLRLGVVSFLNMFPLVNGLQAVAPEWEVHAAPPSTLLQGLNEGAFDLAMIPAFDYLTNRDRFGRLADSCIGSKGAAQSVLILSDVPISEAESLELDANSHTSNALAKILLGGPLNRPDMPLRPESESSRGEEHPVTCVRIGDRAMQERHRYKYCIDMGEAWNSWQKMPFVFAVWATRGQLPWLEISHYLAAVRDDNLQHIESRLGAFPSVLPQGLDNPAATFYLRHSLSYTFDEEKQKALERFGQLLRQL